MSMMKAVSKIGPSLKSIAKLALQSHCVNIRDEHATGSIIILANGPSLRQTIDLYPRLLSEAKTMSVNFAAATLEFRKLQPTYHILVDPYFFTNTKQERVQNMWHGLLSADWDLTLIVPHKYKIFAEKIAEKNSHISVRTINPVGVEGWDWLENLAYKKGWGMPRPRNVLIAAIMAAAQMGFTDITLCGADHSWMQSIWVDDNNCVVTVQPHFYKEDTKVQHQVNSEYQGIPLHQVVHSFYVAFEAYHHIARYARQHGITIVNATPGSYIDAFPRKPLSARKP